MSERVMLTGPHGEHWPAPEVGDRVHVAAYYYHGAGTTRPFEVLTCDRDGCCTIREISVGTVETRDIFELMVDGHAY